MPKYEVNAHVSGGKPLGSVEAENAQKALEKAWGLDIGVSLCCRCSDECVDPQVDDIDVWNIEDLEDTATSATKPGQIISSTEMTAEDILKRVLRALPRLVTHDVAGVRWSVVGAATSLGSTSSTELCCWAGLDPHEDVGPTEWEHLEDFVGSDQMSDEVWERCGNGDPWPEDEPKYRRHPERNEEN